MNQPIIYKPLPTVELMKLVITNYQPVTFSNSYVQSAAVKGQADIWTNNHLTKDVNEPL